MKIVIVAVIAALVLVVVGFALAVRIIRQYEPPRQIAARSPAASAISRRRPTECRGDPATASR
jgi:hypothetical protein